VIDAAHRRASLDRPAPEHRDAEVELAQVDDLDFPIATSRRADDFLDFFGADNGGHVVLPLRERRGLREHEHQRERSEHNTLHKPPLSDVMSTTACQPEASGPESSPD
jgi:hypothetical protein